MTSGKKPTPKSLGQIPKFDPEPSIQLALELLGRAGTKYALAGRVAVWTWVAPQDQELTKDVDFAIPRSDMGALERVVRAAGHIPLPLAIGGFGVRQGELRIDFIDRHVDFEALFCEAVDAAHREGCVAKTADGRAVPVVPVPYLVAMKMATGEPKDEADARRLLGLDALDYGVVRGLVRQHAGPAAANRLDRLAVSIGLTEAGRYLSPPFEPSSD